MIKSLKEFREISQPECDENEGSENENDNIFWMNMEILTKLTSKNMMSLATSYDTVSEMTFFRQVNAFC